MVKANFRSSLEILSTITVTLASIALLWTVIGGRASAGNPDAREPVEDVSGLTIAGERLQNVKGEGSYAIIEFADFQCPYCSQFHTTVFPEIAREFIDTKKIKFSYLHLPIEQIHPFAMKAAESAECAGKQQKYWEMHSLLYADGRELSPLKFGEHARELGLEMAAFDECLKGATAPKVRRDQEEAARLGIAATPTLMLGPVGADGSVRIRKRVNGALPYAQLKALIESELQEQR